MTQKSTRDPDRVDVVDERLLMNQRHAARLVGISARAFSEWSVQPRERDGRESLYYWPDVRDEWLRREAAKALAKPMARIAELEEQIASSGLDPDDDGSLDLEHEKARLAAEQADKIAMENALTRGSIAFLPDVAKHYGKILEMVRALLLAMPTKCAPIANPEHPNIARDVIEREVIELLEQVAAADISAEPGERGGNVPRPAVDSAAAAEAHRQAVGGEAPAPQ